MREGNQAANRPLGYGGENVRKKIFSRRKFKALTLLP
jgi:hypothetical protein